MPVRFLQRLLSVLIAVAVFASAQEPMKPKLTPHIITATRQVTQFTGLEKQVLEAVQKKDKAALEALLTEDLVIEMPGADPLAGEDWVDSAMAKSYTLKKFGIRLMSVQDLGNAAVVKFERLQEAMHKGVSDSGQFFVVDVWKKDGDKWKLANRFVSKVSSVVPKPKPTGKQ